MQQPSQYSTPRSDSAPMAFLCSKELSQAATTRLLIEGNEAVDFHLANCSNAAFSSLIRLQLAWLYGGQALSLGGHARDADFHSIMCEIEGLEGVRKGTATRQESEFAGNLRGFWHKHFFDSRSLNFNLMKEMEANFDALFFGVFKRRMEENTGQPLFGSILDEKGAGILAHTMVLDALERRRGLSGRRQTESRLTGEWIVYAKHDGKRHYLTLGWHKEQENGLMSVAHRIWACGEEMPFVRDRLRSNGLSVLIE